MHLRINSERWEASKLIVSEGGKGSKSIGARGLNHTLPETDLTLSWSERICCKQIQYEVNTPPTTVN